MKRMLEINNILSNGLYAISEVIIGLFIVVGLMALAVSFFTDRRKAEGKATFKKIFITVGIFSIVGVSYIFFSSNYKNSISSELIELKEEFYASLDTHTNVETADIVRSEVVNYRNCPLKELSSSEKCMYVEFVSDTGISEVFVPMDKEKYSKVLKGITITYVELTTEQKDFLFEFLRINKSNIAQPFYIEKENWSLGVSFSKQ